MNDTSTVIIGNDYDYLVIQALGWDYNLWSVIIVDVVSIVLFLVGVFLVMLIANILDGM